MKNALLILLLSLPILNFAQKKDLTLSSAIMGYYEGLYPKRLFNLQWTGSESFGHTTNNVFYIYNLKNEKIDSLTVQALSELENLQRLPFISKVDNNVYSFRKENSFYCYDAKQGKMVKAIHTPEGSENHEISPDYSACAYTIDNNLYFSTATKQLVEIVENENKNIVAGQAIHRYEFGISKGIFWSPSGTKVAFYEKDETNVADYPLLDITTRTGSLKSIKYPMAGTASEHGKVGVFDLTKQKTIYLKTNKPLDDFVSNVTWDKEGKFIYIIEINRGQDHFELNKFDPQNGNKIATLYSETSKTFVQPLTAPYFLCKNNDEFFYISEKTGFRNIYQFKEGKMNQITNFNWEVDEILGYDESKNLVFFKGKGSDARETRIYSINISTKKWTDLSQGGTNSALFNKDFTHFLRTNSSLENPGQVDLLDNKGQVTFEIFKADNPLTEVKTGSIEQGELVAADGQKLYTSLIKPSNFDPNKKYPVLIYVYGGPGIQLIHNNWMGGTSLWMHWMAEQGYLIWTLDNRGSAGRGVKFKEVIHRNLGKNELADQLTGVAYLKSLNYVDASRIAVHGWSFGGFMTTTMMLKAPDIFTTGVAGGPVIDWKWYEVMYGERYMDTPEENPEGYAESSLLNHVKSLRGDLLMIHGTVDDVVVMQHNLAFVQECVNNGVQIDFFPYPMHPHNVSGKDRIHLMTKVLNYVLEHNKGVDPGN